MAAKKETKETTLVNIRKVNGVGPYFSRYIGRPINNHSWRLPGSIYANPFILGRDAKTEDEILDMYEKYARSNSNIMSNIEELHGEILGCWCLPNKCHGQVLIKILNEKKT